MSPGRKAIDLLVSKMMKSFGVKKFLMPGVSVTGPAASARRMPSGSGPAAITNTTTHITAILENRSGVSHTGGWRQQATRHRGPPRAAP